MHICNAGVDLRGNFVCDGVLEFPPDDGGKFERKHATQVAVARDGLTIASCHAIRHSSGFFESVSGGPVLAMPQSFVELIKHALQFGVKQTVTATIKGQHGALMSSSSTLHHYTQPLSDWRLAISEQSSCIEVEISAELFGARIRDWLDSEDNFWQLPARASARFSFDAITRQACLCAYISELDVPNDSNASTAVPPIGEGLSLGNATIGLSNSFGMDGNRFIHVGFGSGRDSYLAFTEHSHVQRLPNGFLSHGHYVWPRIWFHGIQLEYLALLDERPIRFSGLGLRAFASASEGSGGGWHEEATDAFIEISLGQPGLIMSYMMKTPRGPMERKVTLPWQTLLLRFPHLGSRWQDIGISAD